MPHLSRCDVFGNSSKFPDRAVRDPYPRVVLRRSPQTLLGLLLLLLVGFVLTQADVHGRTYDEPLQDDYGHRVLDWYLSLGSDTSFLDYPEKMQLPQHGPVFETVVAFVQSSAGRLFDADPWLVRSLVCGFTGILGVALMALCALEVARRSRRVGDQGEWWFALAAALALALYPRWTGGMMTNSKDHTLAVAMLAVLWLTLLLARRWEEHPDRFPAGPLVALGVVFGIAVSIRVIALLWVPVVGVMALLWLLLRARDTAGLRRVALGTLVIGVASYLTILAVWPFIFLNPVTGLPDAISSMSKYPWDDPILYKGEMVEAMELPWDYVPTWLWQGSPWLSVVLAVAGTVLVVADLARRRGTAADVALLGAFVFPVLVLVVLDPTLYNALRHFIFVVPPMLLLAAYALVVGVGALLRRAPTGRVVPWRAWAAGGAVLVAVAAQAQVLVGVARIYPYEYMYFNDATGGFAKQHTEFETDYWAACSRDAALWLAENWRDYTSQKTATVQNRWGVDGQVREHLPKELTILEEGQPDFGIYTLMNWRRDPWPKYPTVAEVEVDGVVLCEVQVHPDLR
ncbi:4-amino-4-deoxy-L-arabinose transferase-like glycosyltransferase [Nocardioides sp. J9]|nr:4-amino-4-deoxy-L-arabinose transferase-like glycosyltransferase [Nocardioides sp. J9]